MAKAINWPRVFREEVLAEDSERLFSAFRLGTLYYDGGYWMPGEEVDIRCEHLKIRRGLVQGDLKSCRIQELTTEDLSRQKSSLQNVPAVIHFLETHYNQPVTEETEITVVYYKNKPIVADEVEAEADETGRHF